MSNKQTLSLLEIALAEFLRGKMQRLRASYTLAFEAGWVAHKAATQHQGESCTTALLAEIERLKGLRPAYPPRPPEGEGLPRYGLRWNGPQHPLATPMHDGYWTPWHLANELRQNAERYQWLRSRDLETISHGGVFAGITPQNMVLNEETLDEAIDAARAQEAL